MASTIHSIIQDRKLTQKEERPFSGKYVLRLPSALYCQIALKAKAENKSHNAWQVDTCKDVLS